jgi:hypothetical protein
MEWQVIVALMVVIPVITLPVAFIWYLNIGGTLAAYKKARLTSAAVRKEIDTVYQAEEV